MSVQKKGNFLEKIQSFSLKPPSSKKGIVNTLDIERVTRPIFTPIDQAIEEMRVRKGNKDLLQKVRTYVQGDIPHYCELEQPFLYLQRFIATPNNELLHVANLAKKYNVPLIVGEDYKSVFSSSNELKRVLGKLPVLKGLSHNEDEILEYFTAIDFNTSSGKPLNTIKTKFGVSLIDFHHKLLDEAKLQNVTVIDETSWVDRNFRNDIYEQYKRVWALLCVHGVMVELYTPADYSFFTQVVYPSFKEVEAELGVTPMIVEYVQPEIAHTCGWNSYPSFFYQHIKRQFKG